MQAGEILEEVASRLDAASYASVADQYREQAALAFSQAHDRERARETLLDTLRGRLERGEEAGHGALQRFPALVDAEQSWIADAIEVIAGWPEVPSASLDVLTPASERAAGRDDEAWWAAVAVELLCLDGRFEDAQRVGRAARARIGLETGPRLRLELDWLDALEQTSDRGRTHNDPLSRIAFSDARLQPSMSPRTASVTARRWRPPTPRRSSPRRGR